VLALSNGDVVVAGSDAHIRIFSRNAERQASDEDIAAFDSLVSASSIPSNQVGDLNKEKLEGLDGLSFPGRKEGEVKMIRVGNIVEAHQVIKSRLSRNNQLNVAP
jgi:phospholipase A-2-activating protein